VAYDPPTEMRTGGSERTSVRILPGDEMHSALIDGLRGSGAPQTERIPTSATMSVRLSSSAPDRLTVEALSEERQVVLEDQLTHWDFVLNGLAAGTVRLRLVVSCVVRGSDGERGAWTVPAIERDLRVRINPRASFSRWFRTWWRWLVGTLIALASLAIALLR
jgi:hypothetical protein